MKLEYDRDEILDKIECRATAECNLNRLAEHNDCNYCHLTFDCKYYKKETGDTICDFVQSLK